MSEWVEPNAQYFAVRQRAFTLVEVIFVVLILGLVSVIGSSFVSNSITAYTKVDLRAKLIQRGRLAIEQMARELRISAPNSVRISGSGGCIEFLPVLAATRYLPSLATVENGAAAQNSVDTVSFSITQGTASHVVIAPHFSTEIYTLSSPSARVQLGAIGASPYTNLPFSSSHTFLRDSSTRRLFVTSDPVRYCISGTDLLRVDGYGLDAGAMSDVIPAAGATALASQGVSTAGSAFVLSPSAEDRNASVDISLIFSRGTESVDLSHQVYIRNVP